MDSGANWPRTEDKGLETILDDLVLKVARAPPAKRKERYGRCMQRRQRARELDPLVDRGSPHQPASFSTVHMMPLHRIRKLLIILI